MQLIASAQPTSFLFAYTLHRYELLIKQILSSSFEYVCHTSPCVSPFNNAIEARDNKMPISTLGIFSNVPEELALACTCGSIGRLLRACADAPFHLLFSNYPFTVDSCHSMRRHSIIPIESRQTALQSFFILVLSRLVSSRLCIIQYLI